MHEILVNGSGLTRDTEMHATSELGTNVPAFLAKLWKMVEDPKTNNLISWAPNGRSFFIRNQSKFTSELLPHYYKHNNMASFIRQLNMYGFHKKVSVELGGLKCDKDEIEFAHQYFCKGHPYLVEHIKRKVASNKNQDTVHPAIKPEVVSKMLAEVKNMKGRQENIDSTINEIKLENATLWRELALLRRKHIKQQHIINKLIQFLVTLVQPSRSGLSVKRRYPLMINDSGRLHKQSKLSKPQECPMGPVIHELDASESDVDSDYIVAEMLENKTPTVQSPEQHIEAPTYDEDMETVQFQRNLVQNPKIETKKKHGCKGKKKRKNTFPVKFSIPSENGERTREEVLMFEIPDENEPVTSGSKPVPIESVRSSKLTAMAANIKSQDVDNDIDIDTQAELEEVLDETSMKLDDILIVPEMLDDSSIQNYIENTEDDNSNPNEVNKRLNQTGGGRSVLVTSNNDQRNENRMIKSLQTENNSYDKASPSSSKGLSVSRVNSSGMTEANYRLEEPTEEINNHVETLQNGLDNLRDMLCSENCIDANSLLNKLFSTDDPMTLGLPINPELNPDCGKEDDDHIISDSANGGELMAYNSSNLLDFDDMLLANASSLSNPSDLQMNNLYTSDIDIENTKVSLLDDLVTNNANAKS